MQETELTPVSKSGEYLEVHPATLQAHQSQGWQLCARAEPEADKPKRGRQAKAEAEPDPAPEAE